MHQLAQQPLGGVLVWLVTVGMFLLVIWRLVEAAAGHRDEEGSDRLRKRLVSLGKAVMYAVVGVLRREGGAERRLRGRQAAPTPPPRSWAGRAGQWIVAAIGLAAMAYGANLIRRAWTEKFREHLSGEGQGGEAGRPTSGSARPATAPRASPSWSSAACSSTPGYTHQAKKAGGLDDALHTVLQQPFGPVLLGLIALGIACYGLFCFARARHLSR